MTPASMRAPAQEDIERAAAVLARLDVARTPTIRAARLEQRIGTPVALKLENLQRTGSFKVRGAGNRIAALSPTERARGVIAMSAGNHAQGVAWHAQRQSIPATIVMPRGTPFTKIERTQALGARVVIEGATLDQAAAFAREEARRGDLVLVHPYDDPLVVAGQGTVALELLADRPDIDTLVVPIGGGGLIAGCAIAARSRRPGMRIVGVQSALYPAMLRAIRGDGREIPGGPSLAEGIAVKAPGELTRRIVRDLVDDIVLVDEHAIEAAVNFLLVEEKLLVEGAGAAGIAALMVEPERWRGRRIGAVVCGGNIDARVAASILMRGLAASGRLARLRIEIPDAPGMLAGVTETIAGAGGNIVEIVHQRLFHDVPVTRADVDVVLETRGGEHLQTIVAALIARGLRVARLGEGSMDETKSDSTGS
jgi:threonine dehydratase